MFKILLSVYFLVPQSNPFEDLLDQQLFPHEINFKCLPEIVYVLKLALNVVSIIASLSTDIWFVFPAFTSSISVRSNTLLYSLQFLFGETVITPLGLEIVLFLLLQQSFVCQKLIVLYFRHHQ